MDTDISFQEAAQQLEAFLKTENRPHVIRRVFRDDLLRYKRIFLLCWPLPESNEQQAEALFYQGQQKGLGLKLEIIVFDQMTAYGYVLVPEDSEEAEALMMTSLKLGFITDNRKIIKIKSKLLWKTIKRLLPNQSAFTELDLVPPRNSTVSTNA